MSHGGLRFRPWSSCTARRFLHGWPGPGSRAASRAESVSPLPATSLKLALRGQAGLTLLETMFALAILVYGILALFLAMQYAALSLSNSKERAAALEIAASRMELVKGDPVTFFNQLPVDSRPPLPLAGVWHSLELDQDFGKIPEHPNMACYVVLAENFASSNTAVVRIPVIWIRIGGKFSTVDGQAFDANDPDAHPAIVELRDVIRYR
jgi:hypothetical protein